MQVVHKPGPLKQQNKTHKHGRHRSNRSLESLNRGKVGVKSITKKASRSMRKVERKNQITQIRKRKREEVIAKKRFLGGQGAPPFAVAIISLSSSGNPWVLLDSLKDCDQEAVVTSSPKGTCHISVARYKQRFSFFIPEPGNLYAQLDAAKVADTLVLVHCLHSEDETDDDVILTSLLAHGLPSVVHVLQGLDSVPVKKRAEVKKQFLKGIEKRMPVSRLHVVEQAQDALLLLHQIGSQKLQTITVRDRRPHLLAESIAFEESKTSSDRGVLNVSGFIRGQPLNVNGLVHIPGWGSFQLLRVDAPTDPYPLVLGRAGKKSQDEDEMEGSAHVLCESEPAKQESLDLECVPDPMEGDQTWPTAEELEQADASLKETRKRVPKGTSSYQAAWIVESDEGDSSSDDDSEDVAMEAADLSALQIHEAEKLQDSQEEDNIETISMGDTAESMADDDTDIYDDKFNDEEEQKMYVRFQEERMNEMFPDEMDTPKERSARNRFARYRGLKSFNSSPWDPNENLPTEYSRIFQFENFQRTKKKVLSDVPDGVLPGWYVSLHIADVPKTVFDHFEQSRNENDRPLVVYGQLAHEQKMSVVNCVIRRHPSCIAPIRSKQRLIFHVGYRRFAVQPIFSAHTNANKHKFERFLRNDEAVVASFFAPLIFPPAPVLVFKENSDGSQTLVATGSVLSGDPERQIIKRVVLSGHPFKINRRSAVVRYMFFDRDDIMWFKPIELRTKYGRRGHIKEPLGTHGHMKCVFDGQLKSQDVILMNLYKRVFPKWTYDLCVSPPQPIFRSICGK